MENQALRSYFRKHLCNVETESTMGVDVSRTESEGGEKYRHGLEVVCSITLYRY